METTAQDGFGLQGLRLIYKLLNRVQVGSSDRIVLEFLFKLSHYTIGFSWA